MDVVAGFILQKQKVLLARRPVGKEHANQWEFPGGKVLPSEKNTQALKRELFEELTIKSQDNLKTLGTVTGQKLCLHFYGLELNHPYTPLEHSAIAWSSWLELDRFQLCPLDRRAVKELECNMRAFLADPF